MEELNTTQPLITKTCQTQHLGIEAYSTSRHAIGYVINGRKDIYYGDIRHEVHAGDIFYMSIGNHYVDNIPDGERGFEQITFYYSPELLRSTLSHLNLHYKLDIDVPPMTTECGYGHQSCKTWPLARHFFCSVNSYLNDNLFCSDTAAEQLKLTELLYLLVANPECSLRSCILRDANMASDGFEQIVQRHIFDSLSIEQLAALCHKSLTTFKKEFLRHFHEPPHKWIIRRRLSHARLLLISTDKSITDIASECRFTTPSHFIKLFRQEYGLTPAVYRNSRINNFIQSGRSAAANEYELIASMDNGHKTPNKQTGGGYFVIPQTTNQEE